MTNGPSAAKAVIPVTNFKSLMKTKAPMTTKSILSKTIAVAAALITCSVSAPAATLVNGANGAGELFIGFRATTGTGSTKNIVMDLGASATFSSYVVGSTHFLGNLNTNLDATFGLGGGNSVAWYENPNLLWSAVAAVGNSVPTGGDPTQTLYGSVSNTNLSLTPGTAPGTVGYTRNGSSTQGTSATAILSMAAGGAGTGSFKVALAGTSPNIAIQNTSDSNSWSARGNFGTSPFSGFSDIGQVFEQAFTIGTIPNGSGVEGALDVFRQYKQGTIDPDNGSDGIFPNPTLGTYQFTLQISTNGDVNAVVLPVPEPTSVALLMTGGIWFFGLRRRSNATRRESPSVA